MQIKLELNDEFNDVLVPLSLVGLSPWRKQREFYHATGLEKKSLLIEDPNLPHDMRYHTHYIVFKYLPSAQHLRHEMLR